LGTQFVVCSDQLRTSMSLKWGWLAAVAQLFELVGLFEHYRDLYYNMILLNRMPVGLDNLLLIDRRMLLYIDRLLKCMSKYRLLDM
jgi:hypothetical protein